MSGKDHVQDRTCGREYRSGHRGRGRKPSLARAGLQIARGTSAGDANPLDDFLIEVVEKLLAGVAASLGNLRFEFLLELVELELDLFGRAALLVDGDDALFKIHTGLDGPDDFITGSEHSIEQLELLRKQLIHANIGGIGLVEEVDDYHVVLLTVAMAPSDALLDTLRDSTACRS